MMTKRRLLVLSLTLLACGIGSAQAETITVTVDKMAFSPADISARVGDTIEWVNKDSFAHTATVKGGWEVMLPVKKSGSVVVDKAGTIAYICRFHPNMKGTITVTAK
jgi:plastocyanin